MNKLAACICVVLVTACGGGGGGGGGGSPTPSKYVSSAVSSVTLSGQVDLNGATLETPATAPTVEVNGVSATVTTTADPEVFNWTATVSTTSKYDDYRVEYFANGNLIGAVDYAVDP